ncbi:MAG TPA: serine/threonine-protein kinase, partial [Kofleriaceae bacterium]|nr:serine/threonine-protein kinase [Kofleriaceae bacterium]
MECLDDNVASEFVSGAMPHGAVTKVEKHLAGCRDCRELVAALAGADDVDSNAATHRHEREVLTESQAGRLPTLSIGDRVGRYLVLSTLGTGGMGHVFAAYDPQLDRKIALKVLRANLGANTKEARSRLKREAQAIAQLNHPNVVAVYDVGTTTNGEDVYIAMEFVEGDTLTTWLKRWPRTWREILEVFHQAARGLMAAHSVGLLHRDFKPDNVLVGGDGRVRVTDFGLARSLFGIDDSGRGPTAAADVLKARAGGSPLLVDLTATGTVLGTPRYMPPEQLLGPNIDARSDQFSFCVALYEALYGVHPLPGATSVAMLEEGKEAQPPPDARLPTPISRAVMRGLAKERTQRFPTMAALVTELTPAPERAPGRGIAIAVVGLIVIGVATAAVMASHDHELVPSDRNEEIVHVMIGQIRELENSNKALRKQLLERDVRHEDDIQQIERDKQKLEANDELIHELTDKVTALRMDRIVPKPMLQAKNVIAAVATAQHDLEGCFDEWAERPLDSKDVGRPNALLHTNDSDVLVALRVGPDGTAMQLSDIHGDPMTEMINGIAMPVQALAKGPDTDRSS